MKKKNSRPRLSKQAKKKLTHEMLCLVGTILGIIATVCYNIIPDSNYFLFLIKFCSRFGLLYSFACLLCFITILNDMSYFKKN